MTRPPRIAVGVFSAQKMGIVEPWSAQGNQLQLEVSAATTHLHTHADAEQEAADQELGPALSEALSQHREAAEHSFGWAKVSSNSSCGGMLRTGHEDDATTTDPVVQRIRERAAKECRADVGTSIDLRDLVSFATAHGVAFTHNADDPFVLHAVDGVVDVDTDCGRVSAIITVQSLGANSHSIGNCTQPSQYA